MNTVVMGVGPPEKSIRFFKCMDAPDPASQEAVVADFSRLLKQGGGQTKYGYVKREGLPPDAPLIHELYDLAFVNRQQSINAIGEVTKLADLADIRLGISSPSTRNCQPMRREAKMFASSKDEILALMGDKPR